MAKGVFNASGTGKGNWFKPHTFLLNYSKASRAEQRVRFGRDSKLVSCGAVVNSLACPDKLCSVGGLTG